METEPSISREQLGDGIFLTTEKRIKPLEYLYTVENQFPEELNFTFDFTGSTNIFIEGSESPFKTMVSVKPHSISKIVRVHRVDVEESATIALQTQWEFEEIDEQTIKMYENNWDDSVRFLAEAMVEDFYPSEDRVELEVKCPPEGFIDTTFLPLTDTLYKIDDEDAIDERLVGYRRCATFLRESPRVFGEYLNVKDIQVGLLPDMWLISSLACIAEVSANPNLVKALFPSDCQSFSQVGVYKVQLFKNGEWTTVLIDDYIPCYRNGGPAYSHLKSGHMWVMLIEKAFAKLHGNYTALTVGAPYEAMIDLTGVPTICLHFDDEEVLAKAEDGSLWRLICMYEVKGFILTVSIGTDAEDESVGLLSGHAFSVRSLKLTSQGKKLVSLNNPWKILNRDGEWSPSSSNWNSDIKREVGATDDDTVFWMSFEEVLEFFSCLNVCMIRRSSNTIIPWHSASSKLEFLYDAESGEAETPIFTLKANADGEAHITIHQRDEHIVGAEPYIDIGVTVLQVDKGKYSLVGTCGNTAERQNMASFDAVCGIEYIVVPTTGCAKFKQFSLQSTTNNSSSVGNLTQSAVIHVNCEAEVSLSPYITKNTRSIYNKAMELALLGGYCIDIVEDAMQMYSLRGGNAGISYGAYNSSTNSIRLTTDFATDSVNIFSNRGSLVSSVVIAPGELKILQHICPFNEKLPWEAVWDCKVLFYDEDEEAEDDDELIEGEREVEVEGANDREIKSMGSTKENADPKKSTKANESNKENTLPTNDAGEGNESAAIKADSLPRKGVGCKCSVM